MRRKAAGFAVVCVSAVLAAGCSSGRETAAEAAVTAEAKNEISGKAAAAEQKKEQEADEKMDTKDSAILVISFGTSYHDSRDRTIGAVENAIAQSFPEFEVRRAFTSQIIIDILANRDGLEIDNVEEALDRAAADGVKTLVVQPTHLMNGFEYTDLVNTLAEYEEEFEMLAVAEPLLTSEADFDAAAAALVEYTASYDDGETAICFMGHGTEAESNEVYEKLQDKFRALGYENYYIGTVEAEPSLETVLEAVNAKGGYKKVVLEPLMLVAGDHANNDMAGDEEESWKTVMTGAGYEVTCIMDGLGQIPAIQDLYTAHTKAAVDSLKK